MKTDVEMELDDRDSCSRSMLTLLNAVAGTPRKVLEEASAHLYGQVIAELEECCGIFWDGSLAAGVRASERIAPPEAAAFSALAAAKELFRLSVEIDAAETCGEFNDLQKYQIRMKEYASLFHKKIDQILDEPCIGTSSPCRNCAVEGYRQATRILGLRETDDIVTAGLAGGVGLSGNVCGALSASLLAIAVKYFENNKKSHDGKTSSILQEMYIGDRWMTPLHNISRRFLKETGFKQCYKRTERYFKTPEELSIYLQEGHCDEVLKTLDNLLKS